MTRTHEQMAEVTTERLTDEQARTWDGPTDLPEYEWVECPTCRREAGTESGLNLCSRCGTYFAVRPGEDYDNERIHA